MTFAADLARDPWDFDLLSTLRRIERSFPDRPKIGDSAARHEDFVVLGEDPFLDFPPSTIGRVDRDAQGRLRLFVKFLGLLGPQGALPLATTDEVHGWWLARDESFPRFLDILNNRFLQLFYRAWADARPIAQHERPAADRFRAYIGTAVGIGTPAFADLDSVPDDGKRTYAGLLEPAARSGSRLRDVLSGLLGATVEVEEFVGVYLPFEIVDRSRLGGRYARLGSDLLLGAGVFSTEDKIRVSVFAASLTDYERLLPGELACERLADIVFFYIGDELAWEVELALPIACVEPLRLGAKGRLGYTSWLGAGLPKGHAGPYRRDARFHPAERRHPGRDARSVASAA